VHCTNALVCRCWIRETSAYFSIRQHKSAYVSITNALVGRCWTRETKEDCLKGSGLVGRQHTPAYVSIRQHTSAYVRMRQLPEGKRTRRSASMVPFSGSSQPSATTSERKCSSIVTIPHSPCAAPAQHLQRQVVN